MFFWDQRLLSLHVVLIGKSSTYRGLLQYPSGNITVPGTISSVDLSCFERIAKINWAIKDSQADMLENHQAFHSTLLLTLP